ncbi:hypothetical protein C3E79_01655 [Corynebacterium liangguodongii]|uniref:Uncharacterized protein n=2 Tax=Corynebacterium liangguodongii TaxID=2079535 RepID=A0A2S0WC68_9CORY|nr:hypothetical protein C3E79_01655 [Corynebacterium liangguodongii]PWC00560.1 hypothetical protein DF219_01295 [Corynebacterium liangguodongii]
MVLSAAAGLTHSIEGLIPALIPVFIIVSTLSAASTEHFSAVEPRKSLLRYRFHVELDSAEVLVIILRLLFAACLALTPLLAASLLWLAVSGMPLLIVAGPVLAFTAVGFLFANRPIGKNLVETQMVLLELLFSYAFAFIFVWSPLVGACALAIGLGTTLFVARARLLRMVHVCR